MTKTFRISILCFILFFQAYSTFGSFAVKIKEKEPETSVNPNEVKTVPPIDATKSSIEDFKNLSRKEKRDKFKDLKKAIKEYRLAKKQGEDINTNTLILILLAILIPPLAVYLHEGTTNNKFWINVLLTVLGYVLFGSFGLFFLGSIPGIIHALIVILGTT